MKMNWMTRLAFALLPIIASLAITALLITLVGSDPRAVFERVFEGAFRNSTAFAGVVNFWIPLVLCSMGLVVTFTAGLWNIGVEGQMMVGAIFASWGAQFLALPAPLQVGAEIALAMAGGAVWASLAGLLKVRLGVHEIFGGVALNALANVWAIYLISGPWQPPEGGSAQATRPFPPDAVLPSISNAFPVSLLGLIIAFLAVVGVALALRGTRWGLQLKATGKNPRSALLLGVPTTQSALTALIVCGVLAGAAGSYRALFTYTSLRPLLTGGIGFLGLLVVLLVGVRAIWTPLVAFAFAVVLGGSTRLRVALQLDQSLAGVLQSTVVLMVLLANGLRRRLSARRSVEAPQPTQTAVDFKQEQTAHE